MSDDVWVRPDLEQQAEAHWLVAMAKAAIPQAKHWHGGPERCPVCGGLAPDKRNDATKGDPVGDESEPF